MGYSTDFTGELKFANEISVPALAKLKSMFGEDCREHPEWEPDKFGCLYYVDLELTDMFSGVAYDGSEKTSLGPGMINMITAHMRKEYPDFCLSGELLAQGEDIEDRWRLVMLDGIAKKVNFTKVGDKIRCPHCEREFYAAS